MVKTKAQLPIKSVKKKAPIKRKKKKSNVGRPTIMTESTLKKLEEAFSFGANDLQACLYADISHQTLYTYQNEHPEFIDRKNRLKENVKLHAKRNVSKAVIGTGKSDGDIDTSKYVLDRTDKDFRPKNKLEIEGVLSREEMEEQARLTAEYLEKANKEKK